MTAKAASELIYKLTQQRYFGKITFNFESGKITYLEKREIAKDDREVASL